MRVTKCAGRRSEPVHTRGNPSWTIVRMASIPRLVRLERAVLVAPLLVLACAMTGCAVVSVAGAAVGVAGAAAGAALSVGGAVVGSTVKVAGKVVEKTVDLATPGGSPAAVAK
jgi:hypothetical protein